jgi:hypothetical protein
MPRASERFWRAGLFAFGEKKKIFSVAFNHEDILGIPFRQQADQAFEETAPVGVKENIAAGASNSNPKTVAADSPLAERRISIRGVDSLQLLGQGDQHLKEISKFQRPHHGEAARLFCRARRGNCAVSTAFSPR